ncbi:MAG: hypothetical protein NZ534_09445, partial [Bacteroidia bacterium]|nr:hypothetical protein [Bacteroidia bacterium]
TVRVCDSLFELENVVVARRRVEALLHIDAQTQLAGNEVRRNAGYFGRIVERGSCEYLVQILLSLTRPPRGYCTRIEGFPNAFGLFLLVAPDLPAEELFGMGCPEAALLAMLSDRCERNFIVERLVETLVGIPILESRQFWFEGYLGFGELRKDKRIFKMDLVRKVEDRSATDERLRELESVYGSFYEDGFAKGEKSGFASGFAKGEKSGLLKAARIMKEQGMDWRAFALAAGLDPDQI